MRLVSRRCFRFTIVNISFLAGINIICPLIAIAQNSIEVDRHVIEDVDTIYSHSTLDLNNLDDLESFPDINPAFSEVMLEDISSFSDEGSEKLSEGLFFSIRGFKFQGSTVFDSWQLCEIALQVINSNRELQNIITHLEGDLGNDCEFSETVEVTFSVLSQVRSEIDQHYINQGYITSGSYIPTQGLDRENSVVKIEIVEGHLEGIDILFKDGDKLLDVNYLPDELVAYVCNRLEAYLYDDFGKLNGHTSLSDGKSSCETPENVDKTPSLNQKRLTDALELLRLDPMFYQVDAELLPGTEVGQNNLLTILSLCNREFDCPDISSIQMVNGLIGLNNSRSSAIGDIERQVRLNFFNVFNSSSFLGPSDRLTLEYANTDGSDSLDAELYLPLNEFGESLTINYKRYFGRVLEEPFNRLDLTSRSESFNVSFRHPQKITPRKEQFWTFSGEIYRSRSFILGEPFPLSLIESNSEGRTLITSTRVDYSELSRTANNIFTWSVGVELGSNITEAQEAFLIFNSQFQFLQAILPNTFLLAKSYGQVSTSSIPAIRQIGIGGQTSVRGYRPNSILSDNGFLGTVELQLPVFSTSDLNSKLQFIPFFDIGYGWNSSDIFLTTDLVMSTGAGLQFELGDNLSARVDYGIPLISSSSDSRDLTQNLSFSILVNPLTF